MNCVSWEIAIFSQSQFAISQIRIFRNPFYNPDKDWIGKNKKKSSNDEENKNIEVSYKKAELYVIKDLGIQINIL